MRLGHVFHGPPIFTEAYKTNKKETKAIGGTNRFQDIAVGLKFNGDMTEIRTVSQDHQPRVKCRKVSFPTTQQNGASRF